MSQIMQSQLQRAARLFFDRLPPSVQQQLVQTFRSIDANDDGRISLAEIIRWANTTADPSSMTSFDASIPGTFAFLDADRNGTLDFDECKGLFFIGSTASRTCDGCAKLLLESAYTCADCSMMHSLTKIGTTFDLCSSCYAVFKNPMPFVARNPKLMHPHRNMVEQKSELADAIDDVLNQVQCAVCKEYHRSSAQGLFTQRHVHVGRGPYEITVCEWCIACLCAACGNHFQGPRETAARGRWATRGAGTCIPCRQRGIMGGSPFTPAFSPEALQKLDNSPVFEECSTCKAKAKDGSLLTSVLQTISTHRDVALGAANPYSYNMPNIFGSNTPSNFFNPMGANSFGSSSFSTPNFNPMDAFNGGYGNYNYDSLMHMAGSSIFNGGVGSSTGNPFDMLNMASSMPGTGSLDMLNMASNIGNPLDIMNMASLCSIM